MKGCRPLSESEILLVEQALIRVRDKCLFKLCLATGFRISEALSIKVSDVINKGNPVSRISLSKSCTKGKIEGRSCAIGLGTQQAILSLVKDEQLASDDYLFTSRKGGMLGRKQAWSILKEAFAIVGLDKKGYACHSTRKTFARRIYQASGKNIVLVQKGLGHRNLNSTSSYLNVLDEETDNIVLSVDSFSKIS